MRDHDNWALNSFSLGTIWFSYSETSQVALVTSANVQVGTKCNTFSQVALFTVALRCQRTLAGPLHPTHRQRTWSLTLSHSAVAKQVAQMGTFLPQVA